VKAARENSDFFSTLSRLFYYVIDEKN
jgi:hypothetical protein